MNQTLQDKAFGFGTVFFKPDYGDIIVLHGEGDKTHNDDYVKRIVGLPGDILEITDGVIVRNGKPVAEPYTYYDPDYHGINGITQLVVLGEGEYRRTLPRRDDGRTDHRLLPHLAAGDDAGRVERRRQDMERDDEDADRRLSAAFPAAQERQAPLLVRRPRHPARDGGGLRRSGSHLGRREPHFHQQGPEDGHGVSLDHRERRWFASHGLLPARDSDGSSVPDGDQVADALIVQGWTYAR